MKIFELMTRFIDLNENNNLKKKRFSLICFTSSWNLCFVFSKKCLDFFNFSTSSRKLSTLLAFRFRQFCAAIWKINVIIHDDSINFVSFSTLFFPRRRISLMMWSCSWLRFGSCISRWLYASVVDCVISATVNGILYCWSMFSSCCRWLCERELERDVQLVESPWGSRSI